MSDTAVLERRYRRLVRWYPRSFRDENGDEVLGVLMVSAGGGKRWPSAAETWDVLWSALRMRFRLPRPGSQSPDWSDAWAVLSVLAPVFALAVNLVVVEMPPSFLPVRSSAEWFNVNVAPRYGWLSFPWDAHPFYILPLFQAATVIAVLAGWRWVALTGTLGSALYWAATQVTYPAPVTLLTGAACVLGTAALLASPGPRRGRTLLTWGHGVVLLLAVAAVKLSSLTWWAVIVPSSELIGNPKPLADVLLVVAALLGAAAVTGPVVLRQGRHASILIAALLYPYAIEFVSMLFGAGSLANLLYQDITPFRLILLFFLPLVMALLAILIAARRRLAAPSAGLTSGS